MTPPPITVLLDVERWRRALRSAGYVVDERLWPDAADAAPHDAVPPVLAAALPRRWA